MEFHSKIYMSLQKKGSNSLTGIYTTEHKKHETLIKAEHTSTLNKKVDLRMQTLPALKKEKFQMCRLG